MEDQKNLRILANMFHIAPSALRYWDSEGLIRFERNKENNYRIPTIQTMLDICDVILYRRLSTPVKIIRNIPKMNEHEISQILSENESKLKQQIQEIQKSIEYIHSKQKMLLWFKKLRSQGFTMDSAKLLSIKEFSFQNKEDIHNYMDNPYQSAIIINTKGEVHYGLFINSKDGKMLCKGDKRKKTYLKGLYKSASDNENDNNYKEFIQEAKNRNKKPGILKGRYIISVVEDKRYDFYEAWLDLVDQND